VILLSDGKGAWQILDPVPVANGEWGLNGLGFVTQDTSTAGFRYRAHAKTCKRAKRKG
jgi:hypothetical protein